MVGQTSKKIIVLKAAYAYAPQVEPIVRGALKRFTDDVGKLWTSLADYFIRLGHFEKARDIFEEGISTVVTVGSCVFGVLCLSAYVSCVSSVDLCACACYRFHSIITFFGFWEFSCACT
jgi:pentatricopeptide repeat protein